MTRKFYTQVDLNGLQLLNLRVQNLSADPTTPYGKGHTYFNTVSNELRWYNGTVWTGIAELSDLTTAIAAQSALDRSYTDSSISTEVTNRNSAISSAISTEVTNRNSAISSAISTEVTNRNSAITTAVNNLIDGAPAALDTLNELAAALNDDASYAATITTALGTKLPLAGGTMTGTIVGKKITTDYYAMDYNDVPHKGAMNDAINGGVGYGIGVGQAYAEAQAAAALASAVSYTNSQIAGEVINRDINIANAKNEAVGISQTYSDTIMATEVTNRNSAISTEVFNRNTAITSAIDLEVIARNSAISTHNADTTDVHGIADTAALATKAYSDSSIATEVTNRNSAISSAIATEVTDRNTAISTSVSNAISTEVTDRNSAISSAISTEVTNRNSAIAANSVTDKAYTDSSIATEVTNRNTAIGVEATNRTSAIASAIATEVTDRNTAIAAEASLRITGDSTTLTSANTYTDGKFTALTSSGITEGTNLFFTDERAQDAVGNSLGAGLSYNDTSGAIGVNPGAMLNQIVDGTSGNSYGIVGTSDYLFVKDTNGYNKEIELDIPAVEARLDTDGYVTTTSTSTLTNKTLTSPKINENVVLTSTATELNYVHGVTSAIQTQLGAKSDTSHTHAYQTASNELTALSGLSGTGLVKRTGTNTFVLDTNTYAVTTSPTLNTSIVSGTTSFNLVNAIATTVNFAGAATALSVGSNDAAAVTVLNAPTVRGNLTYVDLYNTLATTVNFAGASTTLNIGGTPTGAVIHTYSGNATLSGVTKTVNLGTGGAFGSITNVNIGSFTSGATGALNVNIPTTFNSTTVVQYPTDGSHVANKQYVDNIASGITIKTQTVYTTSANLVSVYTNGTSDSTGGTGVGAKLTASFNGALILDGVGVLTNQRVLVKDQTNALENGIYVVTNPGDGDSKWILTRSTDFNGNLTAGTIKPGNYVFVSSGTYLSNSSWLVSNSGTSTVTSGAIKVGTDPINLAQYSGTPLNISTLGNVSIGTWQATPIAEPYISTSIARLASPTFTGHVHVPLTPTDNQDATSKKYVDDLVFASLPYLPDIIPLDDLRYVFNGIDSRFEPRFQGVKVPLYNPLRLMINLNGVVQTPSYPDYVWQSMLPLDGFMLDGDGYIAFTQVPPVGSTFDGRVMLGPNVNTIGKAYPFKAMDILLGG